jgi:hypothetical protein
LPFLRTFMHLGTPTSLDKGMELLFPEAFLDRVLEPPEIDHELALIATEALGANEPITLRFKTARTLVQRARKYVESNNAPEIRFAGLWKQVTAA